MVLLGGASEGQVPTPRSAEPPPHSSGQCQSPAVSPLTASQGLPAPHLAWLGRTELRGLLWNHVGPPSVVAATGAFCYMCHLHQEREWTFCCHTWSTSPVEEGSIPGGRGRKC